VVGVEPEPLLEQVVGDLLAHRHDLLLVLLLVVEVPELVLLPLELGVGLGRLRLRDGGGPAAVAAGGHPDAGEAVGGPGDVGVVVGAEDAAEGEHGLGEPLLDDGPAGGGEERAEGRPGVADGVLEVVGIDFEPLGDVGPGVAVGPQLGGPGEEVVVERIGRTGHDGTSGSGCGEVYTCTVSRDLVKVNSTPPFFRPAVGSQKSSCCCYFLVDARLGGVVGFQTNEVTRAITCQPQATACSSWRKHGPTEASV
jgi:hypothetical protein